jgi:hypothetical protein
MNFIFLPRSHNNINAAKINIGLGNIIENICIYRDVAICLVAWKGIQRIYRLCAFTQRSWRIAECSLEIARQMGAVGEASANGYIGK